MSQFSRRSKWLASIFPQSVAPATQDPTQRSDDVSLVQPYDGSGWAIEPTSFPALFDPTSGPLEIRTPFVGIMDFVSTIGITTVSDLFNIPEELVCRILTMSQTGIAGIGAETNFFFMAPHNGSGVTNHDTMVTDEANLVASWTLHHSWTMKTPIMLPGTQLSYFFSSGDVASQARISIGMVIAPVGTVFYL